MRSDFPVPFDLEVMVILNGNDIGTYLDRGIRYHVTTVSVADDHPVFYLPSLDITPVEHFPTGKILAIE